MKNLGKRFEENWRKSLPESEKLYYYRLKDSASSYYGGNTNLRFSANNIADAFMFYIGDFDTHLFVLEYKSHKGKSLPLTCIRDNQLTEMLEASKKMAVMPMLVVFFSDIERCFSLDIEYVKRFIKEEDRKSIPIEYFEQFGMEIGVKKLRTNYKYDVEKWLKHF